MAGGELVACIARVDGLSGEWVREEQKICVEDCKTAFLWAPGIVALSGPGGLRFEIL